MSDIARDILMVDGEDMVWLQLLLLLKTYNQRHGFAQITLQSFSYIYISLSLSVSVSRYYDRPFQDQDVAKERW
jgi:hypothetical protein